MRRHGVWYFKLLTFLVLCCIGTTAEGRDIWALSVSPTSVRPSVSLVVTSLVHAREWITGMSVMWVIEQMITTPSLCGGVEWVFVPIMNPDGYEYSRSTDRVWRKNRSPPPVGSACIGTDVNRNFPFQWGVSGDSTDPCSIVYRGSAAGSENETQALIGLLSSLGPSRCRAFTDVHSFFTSWTSVYGYSTILPANYNALLSLMQKIQTAVAKSTGITYSIGTDATVISPASGGTDDYAYGAGGINASFTVELRGNSFVVPVSDIPLAGADLLAGFGALANGIVGAGGSVIRENIIVLCAAILVVVIL